MIIFYENYLNFSQALREHSEEIIKICQQYFVHNNEISITECSCAIKSTAELENIAAPSFRMLLPLDLLIGLAICDTSMADLCIGMTKWRKYFNGSSD